MSYRLQLNEPLAEGVRRVACEQLDRAQAELSGPDGDVAYAVHQVRKRCKKMRGLLRLVRGSFVTSYRRENAALRDLGRGLSGPRDAQAVLECFDTLLDAYSDELAPGAFDGIRRVLVERSRGAHRGGELAEQVAGTAAALQDTRLRVSGWRLDKAGFAALESGLYRTYRRARKAQRVCYRSPTPERFHEWRKRVKYHWYHLRLLRDLWLVPMKGLAGEAGQLADLLGDDHDLAVLRETLAGDRDASGEPERVDVLSGLAQRRQGELRDAAWSLGRRLFADKPRRFCRRMHRYWQAAQYDTQSTPQD
jgi:CHAD domain-containing protein